MASRASANHANHCWPYRHRDYVACDLDWLRLLNHAGAQTEFMDAGPRGTKSHRAIRLVATHRRRFEVSYEGRICSRGRRQGVVHDRARVAHGSRHDHILNCSVGRHTEL